MNKKLKYLILPILVTVVALFWSESCHADLLEDVAATLLGIDRSDNCQVPALLGGENVSACWFCNMFKVIFNAGSVIAGVAYNTFASDLGTLMAVFLAVSLALLILKHLASFGGADAGSIMDEVMKKTFVIVALFLILTQDYYYILNLTIVPIFDTAFELVGLRGSHVEGMDIGATNVCSDANGIKGFALNATENSSGGMPQSLGTMIVCAVKALEVKILTLFDFGDWAFCRGLGPDRLYVVIPHPFYIIDGIVLYIGGLLLMISYPWIMADAVIQLGIAFSLLPFAICGYGFSGTKKYLPKIFSWILNTVFIFTFMAILVNVLIGYIEEIVKESVVDGAVDPETLFTSPTKGIVFFGGNMIMILFVIYIVYLYVPQIKDLAGQFANGASLGAASAIDTLLRKQVNKATDKIADHAGKALGEGMRVTGNAVGRGARAGVRRGMVSFVNQFGHKDADGNMSFAIGGQNAPRAIKWLSGNMKFTAVKGADGRTALRREYTDITGNKHVMLSDKYSSVHLTYTKDGRQIASHTKFKTRELTDRLFDKKGNINTKALKDLMNSPIAQQNPAFKQAIMEQIALNTLKKNGKNISTNFSSRKVRFDPNDPSKIYIEQVDHRGKVTKVSMDINMQTGQVAVGMVRDKSLKGRLDMGGDREVFFTNGAVTVDSKMKVAANGAVYDQVSKVSYSEAVLKGHNGITSDAQGKQIIDADGTISSEINQDYLLFGLNKTVGNVEEVKPSRVVLDKEGKILGYLNNDGHVINKDGMIVGSTDKDGKLQTYYGTKIDCSIKDVKGSVVEDKNGKFLGYVKDGYVIGENGGNDGYINSAGKMVDNFGNPVDCTINTTVKPKVAVGKNGEFLGYIYDNGRVVDKDNNIVGKTNANGQVLNMDGSGAVIGASVNVDLIKKDGKVVGYIQGDGIARDINTGGFLGVTANGKVYEDTTNIFNRDDVIKAFSELRAKKSNMGQTTAFNDIPFGVSNTGLSMNTYVPNNTSPLDDTHASGDTPVGDGDNPDDGGDNPSDGGDNPDDGSDNPDDGGDTPDGDNPTGDGDNPDDGGDTPDGDNPTDEDSGIANELADVIFGEDKGNGKDDFEIDKDIQDFLSDPNVGSQGDEFDLLGLEDEPPAEQQGQQDQPQDGNNNPENRGGGASSASESSESSGSTDASNTGGAQQVSGADGGQTAGAGQTDTRDISAEVSRRVTAALRNNLEYTSSMATLRTLEANIANATDPTTRNALIEQRRVIEDRVNTIRQSYITTITTEVSNSN